MIMSNRQLFMGTILAQQYAKFRPTYTPALFKTIANYYEEGKGPRCNYDLAVDAGCGSGQSTLPLAKYFKHVIGVDVSQNQINNAPKHEERVEFKVCSCENLWFLQKEVVDILTSGTALHWFDQIEFYTEVQRVLKPGGVLAIYSYGPPTLENAEGQKDYVKHKIFLKNYWKMNLGDLLEMPTFYKKYTLPFPESKWTEDATFVIRKKLSLNEFIGYIVADHAWQLYSKDNPQSNQEYLETFKQRLSNIYNSTTSADSPTIDAKWRVVLGLGRKPIK